MTEHDHLTDGYGDEDGDPRLAIGANYPPLTYEEELKRDHQSLFLRLEALKLDREKLPVAIEAEAHLQAVGAFVVAARALIKDAEAAHRTGSEAIKAKAKTWDKLFLTGGLKGAADSLRSIAQALADDYTEKKERERRAALAAEAERLQQEAGARQYEAQAYAQAGAHTAAEVVESQAEHTAKAAARLEAKSEGKTADVVRTNYGNVTASGRKVPAYELDLAALDLNLLKPFLLGGEAEQLCQRYADRMRGDAEKSLPGLKIFLKTVSTFR